MTTKIRHKESAAVGAGSEQYFREIFQRIEHLESVQGIHTPTGPERQPGNIDAFSLGEREPMNDVISFRIPGKWKTNIEKRLSSLGLPERRYADFYRGAVLASIGNSLRAKSPAWQAFLKEIEPLAEAKLGTKLTDQGLEGIVRQGMGHSVWRFQEPRRAMKRQRVIRREKPLRALSPAAALRRGRGAAAAGTLATASVSEALRELDAATLKALKAP